MRHMPGRWCKPQEKLPEALAAQECDARMLIAVTLPGSKKILLQHVRKLLLS